MDQYEQKSYLDRNGPKKSGDSSVAEAEIEEGEACCMKIMKRVRFREDVPLEEREADTDGPVVNMMKRCFVVWRFVRWILCLPPLPPKPSNRHGKAKMVKGILKASHISDGGDDHGGLQVRDTGM